MELEWVDELPEKPRRTKNDYQLIGEAVMTQPNRWLVVKRVTDEGQRTSPANRAASIAQYLRDSQVLGESVQVEHRDAVVYARYTPTS